jgi:hypothetical protein
MRKGGALSLSRGGQADADGDGRREERDRDRARSCPRLPCHDTDKLAPAPLSPADGLTTNCCRAFSLRALGRSYSRLSVPAIWSHASRTSRRFSPVN